MESLAGDIEMLQPISWLLLVSLIDFLSMLSQTCSMLSKFDSLAFLNIYFLEENSLDNFQINAKK
jgi:hypothetical protein